MARSKALGAALAPTKALRSQANGLHKLARTMELMAVAHDPQLLNEYLMNKMRTDLQRKMNRAVNNAVKGKTQKSRGVKSRAKSSN